MKRLIFFSFTYCFLFQLNAQQRLCVTDIDRLVPAISRSTGITDSGLIKNSHGHYKVFYGTNASLTELQYVYSQSWQNAAAKPQTVEIFYQDQKPLKVIFTHLQNEKQKTEVYYFAENGCGIPKRKRSGHALSLPFFSELAASYQKAFENKTAKR